MEKSSKEKYRFTTAKTSSIPGKNQLLTETLQFIFAISVLSWLPMVVVNAFNLETSAPAMAEKPQKRNKLQKVFTFIFDF